MEEMNRLLDEMTSGLKALQATQKLCDNDMWDIDDPAFAKLRHIHIHLSATVGKLAKLVEPNDHLSHRGETVDVDVLENDLGPILADLMMHAAQVANILDGDLAEMLKARYKKNAGRFAPGSTFASIE